MDTILKTREQDNAVIAVLDLERFDLDATERLRKELETLDSGPATRPLLLDLSAVQVLPSATLGVLVELANRCRTNKRALALVRLRPNVNELMRICSLDQVFAIHADEQAALESF